MASPLASVAQGPSEGAPVLGSPSQDAGVRDARFAELLAMLGKAGKAGGRPKAASATTARPDAGSKGRPARKSDKDSPVIEGVEDGRRPQAARKAEKAEKGAGVKTAVPGSPLGQPVVVEAPPAHGIPSPGCLLQAALAVNDGAGEGSSEGVAGEVAPVSGSGDRLALPVALPESPAAGSSLAPVRGPGEGGGFPLPTNPVIPGLAVPPSGSRAQGLPQGLEEAATRVFGTPSGWTDVAAAPAVVVGAVGQDSLPATAPGGAVPAGTTARPGGRANAAVPTAPSKAAVAAPPGDGRFGSMNLDTLWLFRGDPAYAAAMADPSAAGGDPFEGVGSLAAAAADKGFAAEKAGRHENFGTRSGETPGLVAGAPGGGPEAGVPAFGSPEAPALTFPVVDASTPATLPGQLGREVARWMQGHTRPLPEGGSLLEVSLKPASMGSITIRVAEQDGQLSAQITVSDAEVGHALVRDMPRMADELAQHGVSLNSVSVGTSGAGQDSGGAHSHHPHQDAGSARSARRDFGLESLILDGVDAAPVSPLAGGGLVNVRA